MAGTTISLSMADYVAWTVKLGKAFKPAALRGAKRAAMRGVTIAQHATGNAPPANPSGVGEGGAVNTGHYKRSWRWSEIPQVGARIYNLATYAGIIEYGRRRGRFPPTKVLIPWVRRRLGVSAKEAKGVAFVVARAIAKRGLLPRRVLTGTSSQKAIRDAFVEELKAELLKALGSRSP